MLTKVVPLVIEPPFPGFEFPDRRIRHGLFKPSESITIKGGLRHATAVFPLLTITRDQIQTRNLLQQIRQRRLNK